MAWREATIREFLIPREKRFKAQDSAIAKFKRIEKIDFSGNVVISKKPSKTDMIVIQPGDFVISGINVAKGAMAVYQGKNSVKATIHYSSYIVNHEVINLEYFKRFLKSSVFIELLKEQIPGGIKTEIKPKHLLPLKIHLPDLDEQNVILNRFLNTEDGYRNLTTEIEKQKKLLAKYRQAILQEAIEGKLTANWRKQNPDVEPAAELLGRIVEAKKASREGTKTRRKQKPLPEVKPDEIPFDIPESWQWCRLDEIIYQSPKNGYSPKTVDYPTGTKTLKLGATTSGVFLSTEIKYIDEIIPNNSHLWLERRDILIQRGNSKELVGVSAIYYGAHHEFVYPDLMMKLQPIKSVSEVFLHHVLMSDYCREYFRNNAKGAQKSMPKINQAVVSNALIPMCSMTEQQEIVRRVKTRFALCDQLETQIKASSHTAETLSAVIRQELLNKNGGNT